MGGRFDAYQCTLFSTWRDHYPHCLSVKGAHQVVKVLGYPRGRSDIMGPLKNSSGAVHICMAGASWVDPFNSEAAFSTFFFFKKKGGESNKVSRERLSVSLEVSMRALLSTVRRCHLVALKAVRVPCIWHRNPTAIRYWKILEEQCIGGVNVNLNLSSDSS